MRAAPETAVTPADSPRRRPQTRNELMPNVAADPNELRPNVDSRPAPRRAPAQVNEIETGASGQAASADGKTAERSLSQRRRQGY